MTLFEKYERQRYNANYREVAWEFTYETWLKWWTDTGKLNKRGRKSQEYCMCRIGDKGPYSPDNVFCATNADNNRDAIKNGVKPFGGKGSTSFLGKHHSKESKKLMRDKLSLDSALIEERVKIYESMDMNAYGSIGRYAEAIGLSHTSARRFINKYILGV